MKAISHNTSDTTVMSFLFFGGMRYKFCLIIIRRYFECDMLHLISMKLIMHISDNKTNTKAWKPESD